VDQAFDRHFERWPYDGRLAIDPELAISSTTDGSSTTLSSKFLVKNVFGHMYNLDRGKLLSTLVTNDRRDPIEAQLLEQLRKHEFDSRPHRLCTAHEFDQSVVCGANCHGKDDCQHQDHRRFRDAVSTAASANWNTLISGLPPDSRAPSSLPSTQATSTRSKLWEDRQWLNR
jgi:hypothetical protein